jgi:hypothetical protein
MVKGEEDGGSQLEGGFSGPEAQGGSVKQETL